MAKRAKTQASIARSVAAMKGAATRRARAEGKNPARVWGAVRAAAEKRARANVLGRERAARAAAKAALPPELPIGGGGGGGEIGGGADRTGGGGSAGRDPGPPAWDYDDFGYIDDYYGFEADEESEY